MSTQSRKKSQKVTTLDVLLRIHESEDLLTSTVTKREFRIFQELEASGYIAGQIGPDTHDAPETMIESVGFTTEGRLLMEQLIEKKREAGFWATTWRWLGPVVGWVFGIVAAIVGAYTLKKLGL